MTTVLDKDTEMLDLTKNTEKDKHSSLFGRHVKDKDAF